MLLRRACTLSPRHTLPILTYLQNWDKAFQYPFESDVYFLSTRIQTNRHCGTPNPITIRDKEFGAVQLRAFGIYTYHISNPKVFYSKVSGTRDIYRVPDLDGQLQNTIVGRIADTFASSSFRQRDQKAGPAEGQSGNSNCCLRRTTSGGSQPSRL